jgi:hypothetical protein
VSYTTPERVDSYARRAGLQSREVMMLVARCALVKHLTAEHGDRFVLKGGALLYHVYGTPRVSFIDTDYAEAVTLGAPDPIDVERDVVFVDRENGYSLKTSPDGSWDEKGYLVRAHNLTYTLDDFRSKGETRSKINISVSFRRSERIDTPSRPLYFDPDGLLSDSAPFEVAGLTLNEAAAEKILAWCLKEDLGKHFADLAIIARDHQSAIETSRVIELVAEKFEREKKAAETKRLYEDLHKPSDLTPLFLDEGRMKRLRAGWDAAIGTQIWLRPSERKQSRPITDFKNVETLVREFWAGPVESLSP